MFIHYRPDSWSVMNASLLSLLVIGLCSTSLCQTKIDVSQCFSEQLVTHVTQNITTNFIYNYLAVINEQTYDKVKSDASAVALLPPGLFQGNWNAFKETRKDYF